VLEDFKGVITSKLQGKMQGPRSHVSRIGDQITGDKLAV